MNRKKEILKLKKDNEELYDRVIRLERKLYGIESIIDRSNLSKGDISGIIKYNRDNHQIIMSLIDELGYQVEEIVPLKDTIFKITKKK